MSRMNGKKTHNTHLHSHYKVNIAQHKLHKKSMRTLPLSAVVCIERRLNALQPKLPYCSEGYPKPKPGTYWHISDVCPLVTLSLCRYSPLHAVKKWHRMLKRSVVDVLVFFGRSGPPA